MATFEDIIKKSGNDLHWRIGEILNKHSWEVVISPYYTDNVTNKAREIDIIATKKFHIPHRLTDEDCFALRLFIECKYINVNTVVWTQPKNIPLTKCLLKENINFLTSNVEDSEASKYHYLSNKDVIKTWKSAEGDLLFEAVNGCLNSLIFNKFYRCNSEYFPVFSLPIIVINSFSNIHRRIFNDLNKNHEEISDTYQIEVNYSFLDKQKNPVSKDFLIDVVEEKYLENFLTFLETEEATHLMTELVNYKKLQR